ncbi:MAG: 1,4-dihydroxy-2-naphthoate polyprenyltransferase, partial [Actinobacteria bacterium]|nr:1,4-dihydroxy-2-naphthoate polyprenyltransferase [Actinomycetota bacterium]
MTALNEWVAGARPKTLPAAIAPVLVGTSLAGVTFNPVRAL